jgi:hypothetical protein
VVGTLNLAALLFYALTHLLESGLSACGAGAAPGPAAASVDQQHHAPESALAVRQLVGDPKFYALLARYANLLLALGTNTASVPRISRVFLIF